MYLNKKNEMNHTFRQYHDFEKANDKKGALLEYTKII